MKDDAVSEARILNYRRQRSFDYTILEAGKGRMQGTITVEHVIGLRLDWGHIPHAQFVCEEGRISII